MPLALSDEQLKRRLLAQAESGMDYYIVTVALKDGREFRRVYVTAGRLSDKAGLWEPPFSEYEIADIVVTHDRSGPPVQAIA